MLTPGADPVRKVSIIPRGAALGVTLAAPDDDQVSYTREDLLAKIKAALGGRAAEEIIFGTITTGAESDIDQVTTIARVMVGRWGEERGDRIRQGPTPRRRRSIPRQLRRKLRGTQRVLDDEVHQLIDSAHRDVTALLTQHRDRLETLAHALAQGRDPRRTRRLRGSAVSPRALDAGTSLVGGDKRAPKPPTRARV
jgi:cell division protease FtsH